MAELAIVMKGYPVGTLHCSPSGAHEFGYDVSWLNTPGARPISLSLPLGRRRFKGEVVYNFFDNLLPDNMQIRQRIVSRHHAASSQPFDLLAEIGMDCVGALQIYPSRRQPEAVRTIHWRWITRPCAIFCWSAYAWRPHWGCRLPRRKC